jgi:hypothetical protein
MDAHAIKYQQLQLAQMNSLNGGFGPIPFSVEHSANVSKVHDFALLATMNTIIARVGVKYPVLGLQKYEPENPAQGIHHVNN